jgi:hypothetical protein
MHLPLPGEFLGVRIRYTGDAAALLIQQKQRLLTQPAKGLI